MEETNPRTAKVFMWHVSSSLADTLFGLSNVVLMIGAAAVFFGTIGSITMGAIREHFSVESISANEAKTAIAIAESEKAKAEAAQANERAEQLKKDNLELQKQASIASAKSAYLNFAWGNRLGGMSPREKQKALDSVNEQLRAVGVKDE